MSSSRRVIGWDEWWRLGTVAYLPVKLCQRQLSMTSLENVQKELSQFKYIDLLIERCGYFGL